jgi:hypothetical protein
MNDKSSNVNGRRDNHDRFAEWVFRDLQVRGRHQAATQIDDATSHATRTPPDAPWQHWSDPLLAPDSDQRKA